MSNLLKRTIYYINNKETPEKTLEKNRDYMIKQMDKGACLNQPGMYWDIDTERCREHKGVGTTRIIRPDELKRIRNQTFTIQQGAGLIPKLKKGGLYGYNVKNKAEDRYKSLKKAVNKDGFPTISKRMTAIATLLKNTNPKASQTIKKDRVYLKKFTSKTTTRN